MADQASSREQESLTFHWVLNDAKNIFKSSKGSQKSQVMNSRLFGGGRWKIQFYPNAGTHRGHVSLYLFCEPTVEEEQRALDSKWIRDGTYKYSFQISSRNSVTALANRSGYHAFSHQYSCHGWRQFALRDTIYSNLHGDDAMTNSFTITCVIDSPIVCVDSVFHAQCQQVPKSLMETMGSLLDDPLYSDVEFIFSRHGRGLRGIKRIWAAKSLLKRIAYFDTMFTKGFIKSLPKNHDTSDTTLDTASVLPSCVDYFEDSDLEGDALFPEDSEDEAMSDHDEIESKKILSLKTSVQTAVPLENSMLSASVGPDESGRKETGTLSERHTKVRVLSSSMQAADQTALEQSNKHVLQHVASPSSDGIHVRNKFTVHIEDTAHDTYRAVLYYIYTDTIFFAPLSSTFIKEAKNDKNNDQVSSRVVARRSWINRWIKAHPGLPAPCSAKAVYKLADKLDMRDLKQQAKKFIMKSLTVANIAYEVFSPFTAAFEDIRKIETDFFLNHWTEIRTSDLMCTLGQQLRTGRHSGFDEVWPVIAKHLESKSTVEDPKNSET